MTHQVSTYITGGLGNQLHQLAVGLCLSSESSLCLIPANILTPDQHGRLFSLSEYELPKRVSVAETFSFGTLASRTANLILRYENVGTFKPWLARLLFSTLLKAKAIKQIPRNTMLVTSSNFKANLGESREFSSDFFALGYFQEHSIWQNERVLSELKSITLVTPPIELDTLRERSTKFRPLVVHIRLGDYLQSDKFEPLHRNYYSLAIKKAWRTKQYGEIWLFSDDPNSALNLIDGEFLPFTKLMKDFQDSDIVTLEIMRLGHGYVISNSTFGWWGAQLSHANCPQIYVPDHWMRGEPTSYNRAPKSWIRLPSSPKNV